MMTERHFFGKRQSRALFAVLLGLCLLCKGSLLVAGQGAPAGTAKHSFIDVTNITPERGKAFLSELHLGTVSRMPGANALLVTAVPEDLQKAVTLLALVDTHEEFAIKQLAPASALATLPSNDRIARALGNICIGTFAHPPQEAGKAKAIIDVHNGAVWAIAPIFQVQDIALAVELGPEILAQRRTKAGSAAAGNKQSYSEKITLPDEMQKKLLEMRLRAAERQAQGLAATDLGILSPRPLEAERKPLALDLALAQADTKVPASPLPDRLAQAGKSDDKVTLLPGQVVPGQSGDVAIFEVAGTENTQTIPPKGAASEPSAVASVPETVDVNASDVNTELVPAGAAYEPAELLNGDRVVDLALPEKLPVIQLLDLVGKYMNLDYIYDPKEITGEVTLKLNGDLRGSMKVKDLYLLLESVLKFQNLVMTRHKGNIVTIVPLAKALDADPQLVGPGEPMVEAGDVIVTRVFELEHIDTTSAQNLLNSMKLSVEVTPIAESATLIVTAYAYRMARIEQLLDMVDKPGEPRKFRYRQLRYTMAKNLGEKIKALAEQLESVTVTVGSGTSTPSTALTKKLPGESEAAYRQRLARVRAQQAARLRATAAKQPTDEVTKPGVYLDADERTNRILMIGVKDQLELVDGLIDALDVEQQDLRSMKLYRIEHVDAEEVRKKLQELGIVTRILETSASTRITGGPRTPSSSAARAAAAVAAATGTGEVSEEGPVDEPQVVVVESTNSLLVNATPEQHNQIETIIGYVDREMLEKDIPYKIYPLENSSPDHLATVLQSLIQETTQNEDKEGKIQTEIKKREDDIIIVPDPNTYSLIVYASKKNQEWIANLVKQLDKRRPQVLIDVTLVEITKTDEFNYDLNLIESFPNLLNTSGVTGVGTDVLDKLISGPRDHFVDLQSDGGDFTGYYADRHIQVLLQAMKSKNYGRVLAKPKILVNDNEPGTIKTTDTTYVEKTSSIPVSSGGAGQDTTLIQTATDFTPYKAGIELLITPHISEGDLLRLDILLTRSDFLPGGDADKPPNTTESEVATAVTVPDGSTVILGGLLKLNQNKGGTKVPILGDLPLLGGLFRSVSNEDRQSKLYVFVKAEVIRPEEGLAHGLEDLEKLSERNRLAFEKHEKEFQDYQSWPGVKAKPVHPEKVLEAQ